MEHHLKRMLDGKKYKSLFSCTEEDKGNCPLLNLFSIPTVAASLMPPVAMALAFVEGGDLTGAFHFNGAFMIPLSIWLITHHIIQKHEAISSSRLSFLFNKQQATSFVGCSNIVCS
jgi:hypothetical protein